MNKKENNKTNLTKKLARLEFINDQLLSEIAYLDKLMRQVGFTEGLESLKSTARELFESGIDDKNNSEAA
jgi:hypothetical protein